MGDIMRFFHKVKIYLILFALIAINITGCKTEGGDNEITVMVKEAVEQNDLKDKNTVFEKEHEDSTEKTTKDEKKFIKWAVPRNLISVENEWIERINNRLENDGYDFGVKLVDLEDRVGTEKYHDSLLKADADILFTGVEWDNNSYSLKQIEEGNYECLDEYLNNSELYKLYPKEIWDSVTFKGHIYLVPPEITQNGTELLLLSGNKEKNDLGILEYLKQNYDEKKKIYYGWTGLNFIRIFGYHYDETRGIVTDAEGKIVNPFEIEDVTSFLTMINSWYKNGNLYTNGQVDDTYEWAFISSGSKYPEKYLILDRWKTDMCKNYKCCTAININSENKDKAFEFLELLRMDHNYGDLLIYGGTREEVGNAEPAYMNKVVFGIDDGLIKGEDELIHFDTSKDREDYYENDVVYSPTLSVDLPIKCDELSNILRKYFTQESVLYHDNYDVEIERLKKEYTKCLNEIIKDLK